MVHSLWYLIWGCMESPIIQSNLADPRGMLAVELSTTRKLLFDNLANNSKNGQALQAMDDIWAVVRKLGTAVASDVVQEGLETIRDLASVRALSDIGFLETLLIPLLTNARQWRQANLTSRVSTDLRWLMKLLPRGDRAAVALGHVVLTWVMLNSLRADSDGFVRMESASSITQAWWLSQQASSVAIRQICEVGFNGGHSAWAMLSSALPTAQLVSFDLISKSYTRACHRVIRSTFPRRHKLVEGFSNVSVPHFISQNMGHKCDVIFIDGSHTEADASADLLHMSMLATTASLLVMDDVGCKSEFCEGPTIAWHSFISAGRVLQLGCQAELERRWCWGLYRLAETSSSV